MKPNERKRPEGAERHARPIEIRAKEDSSRIELFIPYDSEADIGYFREIIRPGFFARTIRENTDVVSIWEHGRGANYPLGRTSAGTLELVETELGLQAIADPLDSPDVEYLRGLIRRGDVKGASFAFLATRERWTEEEGKTPLRELLDGEIYDVSPVTFAAYEASGVGLRSAADVYNEHVSGPVDQEVDGDPAPPADTGDGSDQEVELVRRKVGLIFLQALYGIKGKSDE